MTSPQQGWPKWIGKRNSARLPVRLLTAMVVGSLLLVAGVATPASAHKSSSGMPRANFQIKPYSYNSEWQGPMDQAVSNWNSTPTPAWITKSSSAPNWITVERNGAEWYGFYQPHWNWGRYFHITLNARTVGRDALDFRIFVISVLAHELGHALSLDHNNEWSVMWNNRNRNILAVPTRHDIDDVNAYY